MNRLPNEILALIYSQLNDQDIINLPFHLTRGLSRKDTRRRFHHLHTFLNQIKVRQLVRIAANPQIRETVTKISFCTTRPDVPCESGFLRAAWEQHDYDWYIAGNEGLFAYMPRHLNFDNFHVHCEISESTCYSCQRLSLKAQYIRCKSQYEAWTKWHCSGEDVSLLALAMAWLPNLKTLRIDNSEKNVSAAYKNFSDQGIEYPPTFLVAPFTECNFGFYGIKLLRRLVKAVAAAQQIDHSFRNMQNHRPSIYSSGNVYLMLGDLSLIVAPNAIDPAFEGLKCLDMTSYYYNKNGMMHRGLARPCLSEPGLPITFHHSVCCLMIEAPRKLKSLTIKGWEARPHGDPIDFRRRPIGPLYPLLPRCVPYVSYPEYIMTDVQFTGFDTDEFSLSKFLSSVAPSLKHLRMEVLNLSEGTWIGLFDFLRGLFDDLASLNLSDLSNTGRHIEEITGLWGPNRLLLDREALLNLFDFLRGEADYHSVRLLLPESTGED